MSRATVREERVCWSCARSFVATLRDMTFCSGACGDAWRAGRVPIPAGSRSIDAQGYVRVLGDYEHRIVAARVLGRSLEAGEDVHHLNGDRTDNRPENLSLVSHGAHARLHHQARREAANRNGTATAPRFGVNAEKARRLRQAPQVVALPIVTTVEP